MTYIFCLIVLQTLISFIKSTWLTIKICWKRVTQNFFMDDFDLVLLNKLPMLPSLRSFVHVNVVKLLWHKHFLSFHFSGPWPATLLKKEALAQVFSCEFFQISKNIFFTEHLRATASMFLFLFFLKTEELVHFFFRV